MAGPRKVHVKTDLTIPAVSHSVKAEREGGQLLGVVQPAATLVNFGYNADTLRSYDFARHYGIGLDEISHACQLQIERYLAKQDAHLEASTVATYTTSGVGRFLSYLSLRAAALRRTLRLSDIDRDVIDGFLQYLDDLGLKKTAQGVAYNGVKQVLLSLGRRGLVAISHAGDERTFPKNPFPNSHRLVKGETPLPRNQRQAFAAAVKTAVMPLLSEEAEPTSELLTYALLVVALHTGRNTTPLLEMGPDCLRSHPKENLQFLVLWKRRGYNTSKATLREDSQINRTIESMPGVKLPVIRLIRRVIDLSASLRMEAPAHLADRVWLYRSKSVKNYGEVTALTDSTVLTATRSLIERAGLKDTAGSPLRINISRLRKTFSSRVFELLDGDLGSTAIALGNTPQVAGRNYMAPGEDAQRNWRFMGEVLTQELLSRTIGATERTPTGRCTDPVTGQYAPNKPGGEACFSFLDCLRCRNYAVTGDDLYRLFSFYWRVLRERGRMNERTWDKHYAHIPRLIDRDVIEAGLRKGIFSPSAVERERERARVDPHPFWSYDSLASLDAFREAP